MPANAKTTPVLVDTSGAVAVYGALVGATAEELRLLTRDRRALDAYRTLDVDAELLA